MKLYVPVSCRNFRLIIHFYLEIGIMKMGQFMCLGNLQHLRSRFGNGYALQVKVAGDDIEKVKVDLMSDLPGIEIQDQHNEMLFCNVPFSYSSSNDENQTRVSFNLARVFQILNTKKEQRVIESYSVTQTTLEQIFVQLAGEDEDISSDRIQNNEIGKKRIFLLIIEKFNEFTIK